MAIKILMAVTLVAPAAALVALLFEKMSSAPDSSWSLLFLKATFVWMTCVLATRVGFLKISDSDIFRRSVVVVGTGVRAARIAELVDRGRNRYFVPKAFVHACGDLRLVMGAPLDLDRTEDDRALARYAHDIGAREIVVATDERRGMPVGQLLHCKVEGINVVDYQTFWERENSRIDIEALQPSWLIHSDGFRISPFNNAMKRAFDIIVSLGLLVCALPVMAITAIVVRLEEDNMLSQAPGKARSSIPRSTAASQAVPVLTSPGARWPGIWERGDGSDVSFRSSTTSGLR